MNLQLRIRVVLVALVGALVVISVAAALKFHEISTLGDELVRNEASKSAFALGLAAGLTLLFGAWITRTARVSLLDRLAAVDEAAAAVQRGDYTRRLAGVGGKDELARAAAAIDAALDLRDQTEAAMQGRNAELRALLVSLLRTRPRQGALTGIDGEIITSTLEPAEEELIRSVTPQLRKAARTLLSRKFLSADELTTDLSVAGRHMQIRALAVGERRIVGWLVELDPTASPLRDA